MNVDIKNWMTFLYLSCYKSSDYWSSKIGLYIYIYWRFFLYILYIYLERINVSIPALTFLVYIKNSIENVIIKLWIKVKKMDIFCFHYKIKNSLLWTKINRQHFVFILFVQFTQQKIVITFLFYKNFNF